jgi:hypothetical protein
MRFGIAPAAFTLYLGLVLGMMFSLHLGFTSLYIDNAYPWEALFTSHLNTQKVGRYAENNQNQNNSSRS